MRLLYQLENMVHQWPLWAQLGAGAFLVVYSVASVYGRINPRFGIKIFSRVPEAEIRTNKGHIISYTVVPVIVTVGYALILLRLYS